MLNCSFTSWKGLTAVEVCNDSSQKPPPGCEVDMSAVTAVGPPHRTAVSGDPPALHVCNFKYTELEEGRHNPLGNW